MIGLYVDSSKNFLSFAATCNQEIIFSYTNMFVKNMAEKILENLDFILNTNNLTLDKIDEFYVVVGPGSYTGIRIGIATMLGISLATKKQIFGVNIMDALALSVDKDTPTIVYKIFNNMYVLKSYDFNKGEYSNITYIDEKDIPENAFVYLDNYYNICNTVTNVNFKTFLADCKPFYVQSIFSDIMNKNINTIL